MACESGSGVADITYVAIAIGFVYVVIILMPTRKVVAMR